MSSFIAVLHEYLSDQRAAGFPAVQAVYQDDEAHNEVEPGQIAKIEDTYFLLIFPNDEKVQPAGMSRWECIDASLNISLIRHIKGKDNETTGTVLPILRADAEKVRDALKSNPRLIVPDYLNGFLRVPGSIGEAAEGRTVTQDDPACFISMIYHGRYMRRAA